MDESDRKPGVKPETQNSTKWVPFASLKVSIYV